MKLLATAACLVFAASIANAQRIPTFGRYPATVEKAKAAKIDFRRSPGAGGFRTRLSEGLRGGVNFAGHYVVVGWGCGTGCVSGAIVDARDGRVYFPIAFHDIGVWYDDAGYTDKPVRYRKNSRLFVINGISGDQPEDTRNDAWGEYYYEWKNNNLRLIKFVKKARHTD